MDLTEIAKRLGALGNPTRLQIYRVLVRAGQEGLSVGAVQEKVGIPASTLTHHLQRLMAAGLVVQARRGTSLICHADFEVMAETFEMFASECCREGSEPPGLSRPMSPKSQTTKGTQDA